MMSGSVSAAAASSSCSSSDTDGEWNALENTFQHGSGVSNAATNQGVVSTAESFARASSTPFLTISCDTIDAVMSIVRKWKNNKQRTQLRATLVAWEFICNSIAERVAAEKSGADVFSRFLAAYGELVYATKVLQAELLPVQRQLAIVQEHSVQRGTKVPLLITTLSLQLLSPSLCSLELRSLHFGLPRPEMLELAAITRAAADIPESLHTLSLVDCIFEDVLAHDGGNNNNINNNPAAILPAVPLLRYAGATSFVTPAAAQAAANMVGRDGQMTQQSTKKDDDEDDEFDPTGAFTEMMRSGVEAANLSPLLPFISNLPGCPPVLARRHPLKRLCIAGPDHSLQSVLCGPHLACVANTLHELQVVGSDEVAERLTAAMAFPPAAAGAVPSSSFSSSTSAGGIGGVDFLKRVKEEQAEARLTREVEHRKQEETAATATTTTTTTSASSSEEEQAAKTTATTTKGRRKQVIEVPLARAGSLNQSMHVNSYFQQRYSTLSAATPRTTAEAPLSPPLPPSSSCLFSRRTMWPLLTKLTLRGLRWRTISSEIGNLPSLAVVDLSDNEIVSLLEPFPVLAQNTSITSVNLSGNRLQALGSAAETGLPSSLTSLNVSHNFLQTFSAGGAPLGIPGLVSLREIDISHNLMLFWSDVHALCHRSWTLRKLRVDHNPFFDGFMAQSASANLLANVSKTYPTHEFKCIEDVISVTAPVTRSPSATPPPPPMTVVSSVSFVADEESTAAAARTASSLSSGASTAAEQQGTKKSNGAVVVPQLKRFHFWAGPQDLALLLFAYMDPVSPQLETNRVQIKRADADFSRAAALSKLHAPYLAKVPIKEQPFVHAEDAFFDDGDAASSSSTGLHNRNSSNNTSVSLFRSGLPSTTSLRAPPSRHQLGAPGITLHNQGSSSSSVVGAPSSRVVVVKRVVVKKRKRGAAAVKRPSGTNSSRSGGSESFSDAASDGERDDKKNEQQLKQQQQQQQLQQQNPQQQQQQEVSAEAPSEALAKIVEDEIGKRSHLNNDESLSQEQQQNVNDHHHHHHHHHDVVVAADTKETDQVADVNDDRDGADKAAVPAPETATAAVVAPSRSSASKAAAASASAAVTHDRFSHLSPELHRFMARLANTLSAAEDTAHRPTMFAHPPKDIHNGALLVEVMYRISSSSSNSATTASAPADSSSLIGSQNLSDGHHHHHHSRRHIIRHGHQLKYTPGSSFLFAIGAAEETKLWRAALLKRTLDDIPVEHEAALDQVLLATSTSSLHPSHLAEWRTVSQFQIGDPLANGGATKLVAVQQQQQHHSSSSSSPSPSPSSFRIERVPGDFRIACYVAVSGPPEQIEHAEKFLKSELQHACADPDHHRGGEESEREHQRNNNNGSVFATFVSAAATPTLAVACAAGGRRPWPIHVIAELFHRGAVDGFDGFFKGERLSCFSSIFFRNSGHNVDDDNTSVSHTVQMKRRVFQSYDKIVDRIPPFDCGSSLPGLVPGVVDHSVAVFVSCECPQHSRRRPSSSSHSALSSSHASSHKSQAAEGKQQRILHQLHCWAEFLPERTLHLIPQDRKVLRRFNVGSARRECEQQQQQSAADREIEQRAQSHANAGRGESSAVQAAVGAVASVYNSTVTYPVRLLGATAGHVVGYFSSSPPTDVHASMMTTAAASGDSSRNNNCSSQSHVEEDSVSFLCSDCFSQHDHENAAAARHNPEQQQQQQEHDGHSLMAWWMKDVRNTLSHVSISADAGSLTLHRVHLNSGGAATGGTGISGPAEVTLTTNNATATFTLLWQLRNVLRPVKLQIVVEELEICVDSFVPASSSSSSLSSSLPGKRTVSIVGESMREMSGERIATRQLRHIESCALSFVEPKWVGATQSSWSNALLQLEEDERATKKAAADKNATTKREGENQEEEITAAAAASSAPSSSASAAVSQIGNLFSNIATSSRNFLGFVVPSSVIDAATATPEAAAAIATSTGDTRQRLPRQQRQHQPNFLQYRAPGNVQWTAGWICELSLLHAEDEDEDHGENDDDDDEASHRRLKKRPLLDDDNTNVMFAFVVDDSHDDGDGIAVGSATPCGNTDFDGRRGRVAAILTRDDIAVIEVPAATGLVIPSASIAASKTTTESTVDNDSNKAKGEQAMTTAAQAATAEEMTPLVFIISMRCAHGAPDMLVCVAAQQRSPLLRLLRRLCTTAVTSASASPPLVPAVNVLPVTSWEDRLPTQKK